MKSSNKIGHTPGSTPDTTLLVPFRPGLKKKKKRFDSILLVIFNKHFLKLRICCCCLITKLFPLFCDPMDYTLPGSSVHGISQARALEWVGCHVLLQGSLPDPGIKEPALEKMWPHVPTAGPSSPPPRDVLAQGSPPRPWL